MKWLFLFVLLFLVAFQVLAKDSVTLPLKALPNNLKPDRLIQVDQFRVIALLADGLFEVGPNLQIEGKLAESSYWNKEVTSLTIKIKKKSFSDGSLLTAKEVIDSISRCIRLSEKNTTSAFRKIEGYYPFAEGKVKNLAGLNLLDERTVVIKTIEKAPLLKENLSSTSCSIVKPQKGTDDLLSGALGTGPYKLVARETDQIVLEKRDGNGPDRVVFVATNNFGDFKQLKDKFDLILVEGEGSATESFNKYTYSQLGNWQLSFNNERAPFNQLSLRKALSLGLDIKMLAVNLGWKMERLQRGLFPFGMRGFNHREDKDRDLDESLRLFKNLGYTKKHPLKFTFLLSMRKGAESSIEIWEHFFAELPVKVKFDLVEQSELIKKRDQGEFDVIFHGKASGSHEPHIILSSYLSTSRFNTPRIRNELCDTKIKKALETNDLNLRWKDYSEAEECLLKTYFILPLATVNSGKALIRKPWTLSRRNPYLLYPYYVNEWTKEQRP